MHGPHTEQLIYQGPILNKDFSNQSFLNELKYFIGITCFILTQLCIKVLEIVWTAIIRFSTQSGRESVISSAKSNGNAPPSNLSTKFLKALGSRPFLVLAGNPHGQIMHLVYKILIHVADQGLVEPIFYTAALFQFSEFGNLRKVRLSQNYFETFVAKNPECCIFALGTLCPVFQQPIMVILGVLGMAPRGTV